jgi:hypothetical protein
VEETLFKKYEPNWSKDIYTIVEQHGYSFSIADEKGNRLRGRFLPRELKLVMEAPEEYKPPEPESETNQAPAPKTAAQKEARRELKGLDDALVADRLRARTQRQLPTPAPTKPRTKRRASRTFKDRDGQQWFLIEDVVDHKVNTDGTLLLGIKWEGFPIEERTKWQPYEQIRTNFEGEPNPIVIRYIKENKLQKYDK